MELNKYYIELDTCVNVVSNTIVGGDPEESEFFLEMLEKNGIEYNVVNPNGPGGWPIIGYTGTKNQLLPLITEMDAHGRCEGEIAKELLTWHGDMEELINIIC